MSFHYLPGQFRVPKIPNLTPPITAPKRREARPCAVSGEPSILKVHCIVRLHVRQALIDMPK